MSRFYRLATTPDRENAFSGEGRRLQGGRWNSQGIAMVYAAGSLSLAILEQLAQVDVDDLPPLFYFSIDGPSNGAIPTMAELTGGELPEGWDARPAGAVSKSLGDEWIRAGSGCLVRVPSVLVPHENNLLMNPNHADFHKLSIGSPTPFRFDRRLID
jgi:RES domain-containing protein